MQNILQAHPNVRLLLAWDDDPGMGAYQALKQRGLNELARQRALSRTDRPQRDTVRAFGPKLSLPKLPRTF